MDKATAVLLFKKKSLVAYKKLKYATTTNNNMIENFAFLVLEVMRRLGG